MKIIGATDEHGNDLTHEQIQQDLPEITRIHQNALKTELTWEFFGGTIDVEDRTYQVC